MRDELNREDGMDDLQAGESPVEMETVSDRVSKNAPWWAVSLGLHVLALLVATFLIVSTFQSDDASIIRTAVQAPPERPVFDPPPPDNPTHHQSFVDTAHTKEAEVIDPMIPITDHAQSDDDNPSETFKGKSPDLPSAHDFKGYQLSISMGAGDSGAGSFGNGPGGKLSGRPDGFNKSRERNETLEALKWLARHQHDDGSWSVTGYVRECGGKKTRDPSHYAGICNPTGVLVPSDHDGGVTGLAVLAFLGAGYVHLSKDTYDGIRFGDVVRKGLQWMLDHQDAEGCIGGRKGDEYMYDHFICALAMCEAYGLTESNLFKDAAQKAVDFTVAAQNDGRGWRYKFRSGDNDSSATGWAVMVLKSAELAKLSFPREPVYAGATAWFDEATVDNGYSEVGYYNREVGSKVRIPGVNDQFDNHPSMTAVAVMSRIFMEKKRERRIDQGIKRLMQDLPKGEGNAMDFYYWYYGSLAMFQADGPNGNDWKRWCEAMKTALVSAQNKGNDDKKGSWEPIDRWSPVGGRVYATAINALTLEVAYRYENVFKGHR